MNTTINDTQKLYKGFFTVCDAVSQSMGAEGKLAVIGQFMGNPNVTKDGATIARGVQFSEEEAQENLGGIMAKQASVSSLVSCGDGTSTTACLASSIVRSVYRKKFWTKGEYYFNKKVEKGMQIAFEEVLERLKNIAKPVTDTDLERIATISANNDPEIGAMILKAFQAVGQHGIISVKFGATTDLIVSKGMKFQKGFISPFLINNQKNATYEAENAVVLVYNGFEIHNSEEVKNWINANKKNPIVIIAEKLPSEDWIRDLYRVNMQGGFNITAVEAPDYDVKREALLEDIALYVGAEVFIQGSSQEVVAGKVDQVIIDQNYTSLIKESVSEKVLQRLEELKEQVKVSSDPDFIRERIQALEGVSATITVGGQTQSAAQELKDRFDDSVSAIKSAVEGGWVAGGGSALVYIADKMEKKNENRDIQYGYESFKKAIQMPFNQICINARRNPEMYIKRAQNFYGFGYNAHTDESSNLVQDGVIDGARSIRISLENAFSVAKLMLNTNVIIT